MSRHLIPNSTQIPDVLLDHWMAKLSGAEFKVLLYIARRTYGFGKESDRISLSQISEGITKRDGTPLDQGTGISKSSVKRALNSLETLGMVTRKTNLTESGKDFDENTYSINLAWEPGSQAGGNSSSSSGDEDHDFALERVGSKSAYPAAMTKTKEGVGPKSAYVGSKSDEGWAQNEAGVGPKSAIQETDQETGQETASWKAAKTQAEAAADFLELVEKLVENGVGQTVAKRLAREKPDACRQCLEYLPFAEIKKSRGAYLASAIKDGYGPPKGLEEAKKRSAGSQARRQVDFRKPSSTEVSVNGTARMKHLRAKLLALRETGPEKLADFRSFQEVEKEKLERIAWQLSPDRRGEILAGWELEEKQLELFERWLKVASPFALGESFEKVGYN